MTEIVVKIMVELLVVLALVTKQINQGRLSELQYPFRCQLFGLTHSRENFQETTGR